MKSQNLCKGNRMNKNKISDEELRLEIREGVKEAIVDLFLFEPDIMNKFFQIEMVND